MSDAQRELQQRSLTNVRALIEKEQQEIELARANERLMVRVAIVAVLLCVVFVGYFVLKQPDSRDPAQVRRVACEVDVLAAKSRDAERAIRAANPGLSGSAVAQKLRNQTRQLQEAAAQECRDRLR